VIEVGAVLVVPLITGLVEALKLAGLPSRYAALAALASGLAISVGAYAANGMGATDLYDAAVQGIAFGLASAGLYSVARVAEGTARQRNLPIPTPPADDPWRQP
jgi:Flp pilus assembly protein protease CpaA